MSLYKHIAQANPDGCYMVLHKYGYANSDLNSIDDVAYVCQTMVACEGENAFKDLLKLHPDRDVIIEDYKESQPKETKKVGCDGGCECSSCKSNTLKNATGDSQNINVAAQTNTFILLGFVIVGIAIITSK